MKLSHFPGLAPFRTWHLATDCVQNTLDTDKVSAGSHGPSNPTEGAKDNPNNSTPKTPQTGDSTYGSVAQMLSASPVSSSNITSPPTDTRTPPCDSQQHVAGPVLPLQHTQDDVTADTAHCGGQFTGEQPEVKKACEDIADKHEHWFMGEDVVMPEDPPNETKLMLDFQQRYSNTANPASS